MKPYYSLSDFPDRKNAGKNFIARCPKCGTMHLYISKAKGLYHCFYAGCEFNGILTDYCKDKRPMFSYPKEKSSDRTGTYPPPGTRHLTGNLPEYRNATENSVNEVPMLPGDYKILSPAVLQKIKPLDESPECTDPDQLAARRYLADQGISLATAIATHIGCLRHYCITKNSEDKREQASSVFPCIAYVNYVDEVSHLYIEHERFLGINGTDVPLMPSTAHAAPRHPQKPLPLPTPPQYPER